MPFMTARTHASVRTRSRTGRISGEAAQLLEGRVEARECVVEDGRKSPELVAGILDR
jgi:hypothetical protein